MVAIFAFLRRWLTPGGITLAYVVTGSAWILFSDALVASLVDDPFRIGRLQEIKGMAFVAITAALLYGLLAARDRAIAAGTEAIRESEEVVLAGLQRTADHSREVSRGGARAPAAPNP